MHAPVYMRVYILVVPQAAKIMTTKSLRRMALVDDAIDVDSALSSTDSKASGHAVTLVGILTPMDILHAIHDNLSTLGLCEAVSYSRISPVNLH